MALNQQLNVYSQKLVARGVENLYSGPAPSNNSHSQQMQGAAQVNVNVNMNVNVTVNNGASDRSDSVRKKTRTVRIDIGPEADTAAPDRKTLGVAGTGYGQQNAEEATH